jgi:RnfABCDGE-type electron transport complex G subunit
MRKLFTITVKLTLITATCGFLLGAMHGVTDGLVTANAQEKQKIAAEEIFPGAKVGESRRFGSWIGTRLKIQEERLTVSESAPAPHPMAGWRSRLRRLQRQILVPGDQILGMDGTNTENLGADQAMVVLSAARVLTVRTAEGQEMEVVPNPRAGRLVFPIFSEVAGAADAMGFESLGAGYGGPIGVFVGFNLDENTLAGISITDLAETPGVGARAKTEPWFCRQFSQHPSATTFTVKQDGGQIDAISGATITSRAVSSAVTQAVDFYRQNREAILRLVGTASVDSIDPGGSK